MMMFHASIRFLSTVLVFSYYNIMYFLPLYMFCNDWMNIESTKTDGQRPKNGESSILTKWSGAIDLSTKKG